MQQTINGSPTRYVLDPAAGLTQVLADGTNTYLYGNARLGQYQASTQYFGADGLGSVRQLYDASAQVVGSSRYDPFGNAMSQSGATSVFAFAGEQQDATGLQYLRMRYYSSPQGRFVTKDLGTGNVEKSLTLNKYTYAEDNVPNLTDPSGLCSESGWNDLQGLFTKANCDRLESDLAKGTTSFTKEWYQQLASRERNDGLKQAAANLEHYLDGSGNELRLSESFVKNTITNSMPEIKGNIDTLSTWYVQSHFTSLVNCQPTKVGPNTFAWLVNTPDYAGVALGFSQDQRDVAAALGSFRMDVELSGTLHKKSSFLWFENVDAALSVHTILLDVYNWNKGQSVRYPPSLSGNQVLDDWAGNLEKKGVAKGYLIRGDYSYDTDLRDVGQGGLFGLGFDASNPPSRWVPTSCIGSQFDVDAEGPGKTDYCGKPMRPENIP